jgi:hypothetical protein
MLLLKFEIRNSLSALCFLPAAISLLPAVFPSTPCPTTCCPQPNGQLCFSFIDHDDRG